MKLFLKSEFVFLMELFIFCWFRWILLCWLLILCWLESLLVWLSLLFWILLLMISVGFSLFTGFFGAGLEYCVLNGEGFLSGVIGLKQWFLNLFVT